jgi:predicted enzyme related to lactoylglutathione lyase
VDDAAQPPCPRRGADLSLGNNRGRISYRHGGTSWLLLPLDPDLDRVIEQVERAGGRLVSRGMHAGRFPYAYVADPDGYVIEL